jgi:tRNA(Arg) A34 adenosine deaminase TadA
MTFHSGQVAALPSGEEEAIMTRHMQHAIRLGNTAHMEGKAAMAVGVCVVDPVTNEVVATSFDETLAHPLRHAVMAVLDTVAKMQMTAASTGKIISLYSRICFLQTAIYRSALITVAPP